MWSNLSPHLLTNNENDIKGKKKQFKGQTCVTRTSSCGMYIRISFFFFEFGLL